MSSFAALWTVGYARRPFVAGGGRWRVAWALVLVRGFLLSLLGGHSHLVGGCCRSWPAGIICMRATWWQADVGWLWVACRGCGRLSLVRGGCWLKKPCHISL